MKEVFYPKLLPIGLNDSSLLKLYKKAIEARSKLTEFSVLLDRNLISESMICLFSLNESVQSTKIEGTQATFDEVMEAEATQKYNQDILEVKNYLNALNLGVDLLKTLPISTRLILKLHETILKDGRGKNRSPGAYRKTQNWIGPTQRIEDATYIPPSPDRLEEYITNLEKYINDEIAEDIDPLIKIAVIHAQFESIHPFLDGNGRVGRILIMLYLLEKKVISKPTFFVSEELEKNKFKYYAMLNNLRVDNPKWEEWVLFFLESVIKQADKNITKLRNVEQLYNDMVALGRENNIKQEFINAIFKAPIFTIKQIQKDLGISYTAVKNNIIKLCNLNITYSNDNKRRNKVYYYIELLDLLRN
ncbi:Fic family protein [Fusobacterium varium]|uniref:Fic family protein n=1 Tax=Fusobacterium varium TaxID=856 RepID=UPI000E408494|nr:Fic family protein [Fusobacterium varium]MDY4004842.1 Fic family protein [Fusobacterium varium]RGJ30871.1 Fic family protein [Fusobacterium varium]RHG37938.1 Fic family protein [Fusobacterium varium]